MSIETNLPPHATGYLLLFRNTDWAECGLSKDEIKDVVDKVNAWFGRLSSSGKMVSAQPLLPEGVIISGKGGHTVTDGPFVEAKEAIGGYVLLSVSTLEEAVEIAKGNPMHDVGLTTEVRPTASSCPHLLRLLGQSVVAAA